MEREKEEGQGALPTPSASRPGAGERLDRDACSIEVKTAIHADDRERRSGRPVTRRKDDMVDAHDAALRIIGTEDPDALEGLDPACLDRARVGPPAPRKPGVLEVESPVRVR